MTSGLEQKRRNAKFDINLQTFIAIETCTKVMSKGCCIEILVVTINTLLALRRTGYLSTLQSSGKVTEE